MAKHRVLLVRQEIASKYIAIGGDNGSFSLKMLSEQLGHDAQRHYSSPISFCLSHKFIDIIGDRVVITPLGFKYYRDVFSLFYAM